MSSYSVRHNFSLIELTVAIAIMVLISGVVISRFGRLPAFASLQNSASDLKEFFTAAQLRALSSGAPQHIRYSGGSKVFSITTKQPVGTSSRRQRQARHTIPPGVKVTFITERQSSDNLSDAEFICFPDGLISGPDIMLTLRKHQLKLHISPLTGTVSFITPDNNQ